MRQKIVLITGASSGIGKASALLFLQKGYKVYATAPTTNTMIDLKLKGANVLQLDVTNSENCTQVINLICNESERIDILVNNAGFGLYGAIEDVSLADARQQFEVNLFGLMQLTQMILPKMRKNREGRIINISSILGKITLPMGGWYHASKYALEGITGCLRQEVRSSGIKVILINPGAIESEWAGIALSKTKENSKNSAYNIMIQQLENLFLKSKVIEGKAEEVAKVIVKASESKQPKIRYVVPNHAKLIWFLRKLISERSFDYFTRRLFKFHSSEEKPNTL